MKDERQQQIVQIISKFPDGVGIDDIHTGLKTGVTTRTLQRWLKQLADEGLIKSVGLPGLRYTALYRTVANKEQKNLIHN